MSIARDAHSVQENSGTCPVNHGALSYQKTSRGQVGSSLPIERDEQGVWQVYGFDEARAILRSSATKQAGFNAEHMEKIPGIKNRPILYLEGKEHQQQDRKSVV